MVAFLLSIFRRFFLLLSFAKNNTPNKQPSSTSITRSFVYRQPLSIPQSLYWTPWGNPSITDNFTAANYRLTSSEDEEEGGDKQKLSREKYNSTASIGKKDNRPKNASTSSKNVIAEDEAFQVDAEVEALIDNDLQVKSLLDSVSLEKIRRTLNRQSSPEKKSKIDPKLLVNTTEGPVRGYMSGGVRVFQGVPYVDPPVGKYRWRRAPPAKPRKDILEATAFGDYCHQISLVAQSQIRTLFLKMPGKPSEDCLTLNIFTPSTERFQAKAKNPGATENLPLAAVMVFVHGGAYSSGASSANIYNPLDFAQAMHTVIVTFNYRLSWAGFLASEELCQESLQV